jgi:hypothetical protein
VKKLVALCSLVVAFGAIGAATTASAAAPDLRAPLHGPYYAPDFGKSFSCDAGGKNSPGATGTFGAFSISPVNTTQITGRVVLKGAAPNTVYGFAIEQNPGNCPDTSTTGFVTTNGDGNGSAAFSVPRIPGATTVFVGVATDPSGPFFFSAALPLS